MNSSLNFFTSLHKRNFFLFFLILGVGLLMTGCADVTFIHPMPQKGKVLHQFPASLQGTYSIIFRGEENRITIGKDFIRAGDSTKKLSNTFILKKLGNKYIVNEQYEKKSLDSTQRKLWKTYALEEAGCGFVYVTIISVPTKNHSSIMTKNAEEKQKLEDFKKEFRLTKEDEIHSGFMLDITDKVYLELMENPNYTLRLIMDKKED